MLALSLEGFRLRRPRSCVALPSGYTYPARTSFRNLQTFHFYKC